MWPSATVTMRITGLEPTHGRCTHKLQEIASVLFLFIVIINCANILTNTLRLRNMPCSKTFYAFPFCLGTICFCLFYICLV